MPIVPYRQFQGDLARERSNGDIVDYELGQDGVYRPVTQLPTQRPQGRPVPRRNPGLGAVGAAVDAVCLARAVAPNQFLRNLVSASPFDIVPGVRNARERAFNYLCGETPDAQVPVGLPFTGGQCDAVLYDVAVVARVNGVPPNCTPGVTQSPPATRVWGPVTQVTVRRLSAAQSRIEIRCRGLGNAPIQPGQVFVAGPGVGTNSGCPDPTIVSATMTRVGGQPDNCGNPIPQILPDTQPGPNNLSIDLQLGNGNTINSPINVTFNPEVGIQIDVGDINITFDGENIEYTEPTDPGADDSIPPLLPPNGRPGARPSPDDTATNPSEPPPDPPETLDPATDEDDQPDEVIRAVLVTVEQVNKFTTVIDGVLPDADNYFPDLGTVKFRIKVSDTASGFTNPIRVQNLRAFIECPWDGGAFAVVGTPRPGVEWTLTPVYDTVDVTQ